MKQIFLQKQLQAQIIKVTVLNLAGLQSRSEEKTFDFPLAVNEEPGLWDERFPVRAKHHKGLNAEEIMMKIKMFYTW